MYVPFWEYSADVTTTYWGYFSKNEKRDGQIKEVWYHVSGTHEAEYKNLLVCADSEQSNNIKELINGVSEFQISSASSPQPLLCQNILPYSVKAVPSSVAWPLAIKTMTLKETPLCESNSGNAVSCLTFLF